jgi:hypothetical protein
VDLQDKYEGNMNQFHFQLLMANKKINHGQLLNVGIRMILGRKKVFFSYAPKWDKQQELIN